MTVVTILILLH